MLKAKADQRKAYYKIFSGPLDYTNRIFSAHVKTQAKIRKYGIRPKFNQSRERNHIRLFLNNGLNEEIISIRLA